MRPRTSLTPSECKSLFTVVGDSDLCAWRVAHGVVWVQTRNPKHAARLARRSDSRLVARGMAGGYLKTFEFTGKTLAWTERLIARYTKEQTPGITPAGTGVNDHTLPLQTLGPLAKGLAWPTTSDTLKQALSPHGRVEPLQSR